jgi:hypothetical protein
MKVAIIICLILSLISVNWTDSFGREHDFDMRWLFTLAALIMFLIRG